MAVGRLQVALASATSEVTVAAANLNFDFTLVKFEAPKEYEGLGSILSIHRKADAETGAIHTLARQLGALFDEICPATPRLLEAYGKRASEIAKASRNISETYINSFFGELTGIDGTSIWTAATSSTSALHVHLLGCLLARMWTAPEATAIWVELVAERRKHIAMQVDSGDPIKFSLAAAARQDISRTQLATWDASARAWFRTADDESRCKQIQLELLLKNIGLPIKRDVRVYSGVINAWKVGLHTMEKLIAGSPQAIQDGAPLLGLAAWHLYPDLCIYDPKFVEIHMGDSLIQRGGILSLGLSSAPQVPQEGNGVYWSLSLAQLRYYGRPVKIDRGLEAESRISFPSLKLVMFGALLAEWVAPGSQSEALARTLKMLMEYLGNVQQGTKFDKQIQDMLTESASAYILSRGDKQHLDQKLIELGRRRGQTWVYGTTTMDREDASPYLFNLLEPTVFMRLLRCQEACIAYLRHIAHRLAVGLESDKFMVEMFLIRYIPEDWDHSHQMSSAAQDAQNELERTQ